MTDLSPAAIAVDDALAACIQLQGEIIRARPLAAAALRAAADQVVPAVDDREWWPGNCRERNIKAEQQDIRRELLAIAAELEGAQ
jgi:hypothetical protein